MGWLNEISNYDEIPKNGHWVSVDSRRATHVRKIFIGNDPNGVMFVFEDKSIAEHFTKFYRPNIDDYRECMPERDEDYRFWIILKTPKGWYADEIYKMVGRSYPMFKF